MIAILYGIFVTGLILYALYFTFKFLPLVVLNFIMYAAIGGFLYLLVWFFFRDGTDGMGPLNVTVWVCWSIGYWLFDTIKGFGTKNTCAHALDVWYTEKFIN